MLREKMVAVRDVGVARKGDTDALSFDALFIDRNNDPDLVAKSAAGRIGTHSFGRSDRSNVV